MFYRTMAMLFMAVSIWAVHVNDINRAILTMLWAIAMILLYGFDKKED